MSHLNQTRRTGEVANLVATILPALFLSSAREAAAQTITEHPYMAPVDIKSEACLAWKVSQESLEVSGGPLHITLPPVELTLPSDLRPFSASTDPGIP